MDRKTGRQMNRTDFIGPVPQTWWFDHAFRKFNNKVIWLDFEPNGKNQCKKKGYNQHSSGFKEFKNNDPFSKNSST